MADNRFAPRPWRVRLFARPGSRRSSVRAGALSGCLLLFTALLICALSVTSESVLGRASFVIGVALAPLAAFLAVGGFLALRWVDRNGGWR
jgi:hypothetical protein